MLSLKYDNEWQLANYQQDPPTHNKPNTPNSREFGALIFGKKAKS